MDWVRFLEENNIDYVTRSQNTKKGEVSVKCPICGDADPSMHLGINLSSEKWGCHRDQSHRGKSSRTLIKALLGCSSMQAGYIAKQYSKADPDSLDGMIAALEGVELGVEVKAQRQKLEPQFNDFYNISPRGITKRFYNYLMDRGYDNPTEIIMKYKLRCALTGRYKDRIIIPVSLNQELIGWTSRAIAPTRHAPRYLASNEEVKTTVLNYDDLKEGSGRLFIVEGPFDAIRMDSFKGGGVPFRATCTFGTSVSVSQYALLRKLARSYTQTFVLFDQGADEPARNLAEWVGAQMAYLPSGVKDPGELSSSRLKAFSHPDFDGFNWSYRSTAWGDVFNKGY